MNNSEMKRKYRNIFRMLFDIWDKDDETHLKKKQ